MAFDRQQVDAFFRLQSHPRYDALLMHCKQKKSLWLLQDEEGCLLVALGNEKVLPIWHDEALAEAWKTDEYITFTATMISYADFSDKWLPGMYKDGYKLGVAPNLAGEGIVVDADEFAADFGVRIPVETALAE
jgi:hypothetical protein